jgi:hypothetical protein
MLSENEPPFSEKIICGTSNVVMCHRCRELVDNVVRELTFTPFALDHRIY